MVMPCKNVIVVHDFCKTCMNFVRCSMLDSASRRAVVIILSQRWRHYQVDLALRDVAATGLYVFYDHELMRRRLSEDGISQKNLSRGRQINRNRRRDFFFQFNTW